MSRIVYVNGHYRPHADASVHVEDRGYQFADGVYEVIAVRGGLPVDFGPHMDRLDRGLAELGIASPMSRAIWAVVMKQVIRRNRLNNGILYLQVSRGVAPRSHAFPAASVAPSVVITARTKVGPSAKVVESGARVITVPDIRWQRRDIKAVSLLPNVLAKQAAVEAGAYEAFLVEPDGTISEASASNAWIITADGTVVTRQADTGILSGITRLTVLRLAAEAGLVVEQRPFTQEELLAAREVFLTSTTSFVLSVTQVNDRPVGNGHPGAIASDLRQRYLAHVAALTAETAWT